MSFLHHLSPTTHLASSDIGIRVDASSTRALANARGLVTGIIAFKLLADCLGAREARVGNRRRIAKVAVDTNTHTSTLRVYTINLHIALPHLLAVTTAAIQLAEIGGKEVGDTDAADAVVLDNLVGSGLSASANDAAIAIALERERVFAHGFPPNVLDGTGAGAVDAFDLVGADDDVAEGTAILDDEDGVRVATFSLA